MSLVESRFGIPWPVLGPLLSWGVLWGGVALVGCGDESSSTNAGGAGGSAGQGGSAGSGGQGGSAGGAGQGGNAGSGGSGGQVAACTGQFGTPTRLLTHMPDRVFSPAVTGDELELFYVVGASQTNEERFHLSTRSSRDLGFTPGQPVAELNALCDPAEQRNIDVSNDGLRAYVSCYTDLEAPTDLVMIERPDRDSPFAGTGEVVATVGISAGIGPRERTVYSSSPDSLSSPLVMATRASTQDSFGSLQPVPGLADMALRAPSISADELTLFAATSEDIGFAGRSSEQEPFGAFTAITFEPVTGSPEVSADCRSVYYVIADEQQGWYIAVIQR